MFIEKSVNTNSDRQMRQAIVPIYFTVIYTAAQNYYNGKIKSLILTGVTFISFLC